MGVFVVEEVGNHDGGYIFRLQEIHNASLATFSALFDPFDVIVALLEPCSGTHGFLIEDIPKGVVCRQLAQTRIFRHRSKSH